MAFLEDDASVAVWALTALAAVVIGTLLLGGRRQRGRPRSALPAIAVPVPEAAKPGWKGTPMPNATLQVRCDADLPTPLAGVLTRRVAACLPCR